MIDAITHCLASRLDIFCWGVLLGGITVFLGQWAAKFLEMILGRHERERYLLLGNAVKRMHDEIERMK